MKTKAAVLYEMERPRPYADSRPLVLEDLEITGPGDGEVLVRGAAAGLCHSDLSAINGSRPWPLPMVLGHEASGIVWSSRTSRSAAGVSCARADAAPSARTVAARTAPERCSQVGVRPQAQEARCITIWASRASLNSRWPPRKI